MKNKKWVAKTATHLIEYLICLVFDAPNRHASNLSAAASVNIDNVVVQDAVPNITCTVLRRTPPVKVAANVVVNPLAVAGPTRKHRK